SCLRQVRLVGCMLQITVILFAAIGSIAALWYFKKLIIAVETGLQLKTQSAQSETKENSLPSTAKKGFVATTTSPDKKNIPQHHIAYGTENITDKVALPNEAGYW
uniref:Uncharacterized protein n=1 Tax=Parascaris univalens TaxID=6257 RepID=A0A915A2A7_PARUN